MQSSPTTNVPFYFVKKRPCSFFSLQSANDYVWSADESGVVRDISLPLLNNIDGLWNFTNSPYSTKINELVKASPQTRYGRRYFWESKKVFISLKTLAAFDSIGSWKEKSLFIRLTLSEIQKLMNNGYSVGIDFRQVFLVPEGEVPPAHFRPGIDICVKEPFEYKKRTERLSYQVGKAIFNQFHSKASQQERTPDSFNQLILDHYVHGHGDIETNGSLEYTTPLKKYHFHTSALEAYVNCRYVTSGVYSPIIALTYPASVSELGHFFLACNSNNFHEITIVLKGNQYDSDYERQLVHDDIVKLIKSTKCKARVHVFLISKDEVEDNILALRPQEITGGSDVQALNNGVGYYLSSPKILSATYRNIQTSLSIPQMWHTFLLSTVDTEQSKQLHPEAYIIAQEPSESRRASKTQTRKKLKANVKLAVSQQESINQNHVVNQQIQETQALTIKEGIDQSHSEIIASGNWDLKINLDRFCRILENLAQKRLPALEKEEERLHAAGFFTDYYLNHHSRVSFYKKIIHDEQFRLRLGAKLFGVSISEFEDDSGALCRVKLPHYAADNAEEYIAEYLSQHIEAFRDGIFADGFDVSESYIFGNTMYCLKDSTYYSGRDNSHPSLISNLFSLPSAQKDKPPVYCELNPCVLLNDEEISLLLSEHREELIQGVESLLALFSPHKKLSSEEIENLEQQFLALVDFYCPKRDEDIERLKKFMGSFSEHNEDNLRILLQILIRKHKDRLDCFLKLLAFLEERSLLELFYKTHFKYALDCSSVEKLLSYPTYDYFLKLAARTSVTKSPQEGSSFERLNHQLFLFSREHNLSFENSHIRFENLWKRLYLKFRAYTGNPEEAQKLLDSLVRQLISEDGLSIVPVTNLDTFYKGLEKLLDHAMAKHVLKEQIEEIHGISLLPMDTDYACTWNEFKVISKEMQIRAEAINPVTKSYAVSNAELINLLVDHKPGDKYLKTAVFRCLGTQSLREDLEFYRRLFTALMSAENDEIRHFYELMFAVYVAKYTGNSYKRDVDVSLFKQEFAETLRHRGISTTLSLKQFDSCVTEFFNHVQQLSTDEKNGVQSLWSIWRKYDISAFTMAKTPIPEIFLRKFSFKQLGHFLITQKEVLKKNLSALNEDGKIANSLLEEWFDELNIPQGHKATIRHYLETIYRPLSMKILLEDIYKITFLLHSFSSLTQTTRQESLLYLALSFLLDKHAAIDAVVSLFDVLAKEMAKHAGHAHKEKLLTQFLLALSAKPTLILALPQASGLLKILLESYLTMDIKESPKYYLQLMEILLPFGIEQAEQIYTSLHPILSSEKGLKLLIAHPNLNAAQLKEITQFLQIVKPPAFAVEILEWYYQRGAKLELAALLTLLKNKSESEIRCLLTLGKEIAVSSEQSILKILQKTQNIPVRELKRLAQLCKLQAIDAEGLLQLIKAPSLSNAISVLQMRKNQENLQRYEYDSDFVKGKIAGIKLKSHETEELLPLSHDQQELLWRDYQQLMSYMKETPINITVHGISKKITINELDDTEFALLFSAIQEQIAKGINVHQNQLLLCALVVEALYQTTHKFPRCTQILTLLQQIHFPGNIIYEKKTGEGKSIDAALLAAFVCGSQSRTVDITTENDQLAKNGLEKFSSYYDLLGIPHGESIIAAQSTYGEYIANGVNYSTASNLSLFRTRMAIAKKQLPSNPALIADEIDAALTSTVQFRLAATLDPLLKDTKSWETVYQLLLQFVNDETIYRNNPCSSTDDVRNLRNYFIAKNPQRSFQRFTNRISDELLNTLLESAMIARELEENVDFYVVKIKEKDGDKYYAAPIIASTKRPDSKVSYSDYVQQLLHTLLNNKTPAPKYPFVIEPSTETIVVSSPKNFFDYYRLLGGPIIGLTGTAGSYVERKEFYQQHGLVAYNYPTYYPDLSQDLGLITAFGNEDHLQKTFDYLKQLKLLNPAQPVLLITSSPQVTEQFRDFMAKKTDWKLQSYHGYEESGKAEENVIYTAGKEYFLTLANQSLARGADIDPEHNNGMLIINTCTDLTPSELLQIQGRAARNGKPGQYISIIDAQSIGDPKDSPETLAAAFKQHQHNLSVQQQKERAKMRLLEETRYLLSEKLLKLREAADKLLTPQLGEGASIVSTNELLSKLYTLNRRAETHYAELLEKHHQVEGLVAQEFLEARVQEYQETIDAWLPQNKFDQMPFVEPSIPLDTLPKLARKLHRTTVDDFRVFAGLFHRKWKLDGHQKTQHNLQTLDEVTEIFDPYFKKKCSFKQALGQAFDERDLLNPNDVNAYAAMIKTSVDELLEYARTIPIVGGLVPVEAIKTYVVNYVETTKRQISEKKWDEIKPPTMDTTSISNWFSGVNHALTVGSLLLGGPIPFIVNRFVVPTLIGWVKNSIKRRYANSESIAAQLLIGLDNIGTDLSDAISTLASLSQKNDIKVGLLLDKFGPLIKNKALLIALSKYFELMEMPQYLPWVQAIPDSLPLLELYRECKPDALLSVETLMVFLQYAANSELLSNAMKDSPFLPSVQKLSQLKPEFMQKISALSFPEFMSLLKLMAHPTFFTMLEKLPAETTFVQLQQWIEEASPTLPADSQQAIQDMLDYNTNHERLAGENKQQLLNLRNVHQLTLSKFRADLEKLKPVHQKAPENAPPVEDVKPQFALAFKQAALIALSSAFIAYSLMFLTLVAALSCLLITAWISFPLLLNSLPEKEAALKDTKETLLPKQELSFILGREIPPAGENGPMKKIGGFFASKKRVPLVERIDNLLQQMETPQTVH